MREPKGFAIHPVGLARFTGHIRMNEHVVSSSLPVEKNEVRTCRTVGGAYIRDWIVFPNNIGFVSRLEEVCLVDPLRWWRTVGQVDSASRRFPSWGLLIREFFCNYRDALLIVQVRVERMLGVLVFIFLPPEGKEKM